MQKFIIFLLSLSLVGCASSRIKQDKMPKVSASQPVAFPVKFDYSKVWPLQMKGTYLQKITATVKGKKYSFSIHLTLDEELLESVAFSDVIGRLYKLKWTPNDTNWDKSSRIPDFIKPENIIADFLFVHLPVQQLEAVVQGARVSEQSNGPSVIRIVSNNVILRKITYEKPMEKMWGHVVIDNPTMGYQLDIQTVKQ